MVAAAGNQLIGEALHLGKPLLALPESGHAEQRMNGHFLRAMECGDFAPLEHVDVGRVRGFLAGLDRYRPALTALAGRMDGAGEVLRVIERWLPGPTAAAARSAAA